MVSDVSCPKGRALTFPEISGSATWAHTVGETTTKLRMVNSEENFCRVDHEMRMNFEVIRVKDTQYRRGVLAFVNAVD